MKKDSILYLTVFSFVVCFAFVLPLAIANESTKARVAENKKFASLRAVLDAFAIPYASQTEAVSVFESRVREIPGQSLAWESELDGNRHIAVKTTGPGLWGAITIVLAAEIINDGSVGRIDGVTLFEQNETPGLGGRIDESWFLGQFRKEKPVNGIISITSGADALGKGDADSDNGKLDGITGASRTTQAFEAIVNAGIERIRAVAGGSK